MQNAAFSAMGEDFVYLAFDVGLEGGAAAVGALRTLNARGANVTMPLKQAASRFVDRLSPVAELAGAVNTIVNDDGVLTGHNTDGEGYLRGLTEAGVPYVGRRLTIVGAGGAATAIAVQAAADGVGRLSIFNARDDFFARGERVAAALRDRYGCDVRVHDLADLDLLRQTLRTSDILVNGTPVGMAPALDESVIPDVTYFHPALVVTDVIYVPAETELLKRAKAAGCQTVSGVGMNLYQAASAFRLWTGKDMPLDLARSVAFGNPGNG